MPIVCKVRVHESGEEFFAREGLYEKNKNGELVPGYLIITPLGDRWLPCTECSAVSIDGYPIQKEVQREVTKAGGNGKGHVVTHSGRTIDSDYLRKRGRKSPDSRAEG